MLIRAVVDEVPLIDGETPRHGHFVLRCCCPVSPADRVLCWSRLPGLPLSERDDAISEGGFPLYEYDDRVAEYDDALCEERDPLSEEGFPLSEEGFPLSECDDALICGGFDSPGEVLVGIVGVSTGVRDDGVAWGD